MSKNPQISIVIATHNRRELLLRSLQTIFAQDISPDLYEIIVVVDGSTDGTAEALRKLRPACALRVFERSHGGSSPSRNEGIREARAEIILLLDDDIFCQPDLLRQHLAAHEDPQSQIVFGLLPVSPESSKTLATDFLRELTESWEADFARNPRLQWPRDAAIEANTSIRQSVLRECGAFDESIPYQREGPAIGMRLWKRGVRFRFLPAAVANHVVIKTTWQMLSKDTALFGRNDLNLARKVPEYRPFSVPARMAEGPWPMRALRRLIATLPFSPAAAFYALLWPFEKLRRVAVIRRWGVKLLRYELSALSFRSGVRTAGSWTALRREFGMRLPVFMYHHIGEYPKGWLPALSIPPEIFERQIQWLVQKGYKTIRTTDWTAWVREGKPLPEKPILLTFDDAYADTAKYALPVLQRHGLSGVVFVVTGLVGKTNAWDEAAGYPSLRLMDAEQIRYWAGQGMEFGAHTRTHPDLTKLPLQQSKEEIAGSCADLSALLNAPVTSFAYPYGFFNDAAQEVARDTFDLSFTCVEDANTVATEPHSLRRVIVLPEDSMVKLGWRARCGFDPEERMRSRLPCWLRPLIVKILFGAAEEQVRPIPG